MQKSEKRADPRRTIRYPGLITLDGEAEPIPCALRNASQQGAQLAVSDVDKVPDEFVLVLATRAPHGGFAAWCGAPRMPSASSSTPRPSEREHAAEASDHELEPQASA
jgi:hypothetical protein